MCFTLLYIKFVQAGIKLENRPLKVVPIITQLKVEMSQISEEDHGVKGLKKKLLAGYMKGWVILKRKNSMLWQAVWT